MKVNIDKLMTIKNYAVKWNVTPSYVYKLELQGKIEFVVIDGVRFVDTASYPSIIRQRN